MDRLGKESKKTRRYGVYLGIVKRNDDTKQGMARCSVWIPDFGGDPDKEANWYTVSYASPFAGSTSISDTKKDSGDAEGSQTSYGMWMQPPDLNNQVLVAFANGDTAQGYWFACVFQQNMNHSVPGMASNISTDDSLTQQGVYPPVVEYNKKGPENPDQPKRPAFEPLHNGLTNQGLYTDAERGRSSGSARRESPSKTFGYSTPRGTSMMVDDNPENEHIRLRTRGGTQVLVHETSGYVYINSKNGNSWIEISDEGVDVYSNKSISIRAEQDLNFRADRDVFIEGQRGVFIRSGKTTTMESGENTHVKAGTDFKIGAGGIFQCKAGGALNVEAGGNITRKAGGSMLDSASAIHHNGPAATSVEMPTVRAQQDRTTVQPPVSANQAVSSTESVATETSKAVATTTEMATAATEVEKAVETAKASVPAGTASELDKIVSQVKAVSTEAQNRVGELVSKVGEAAQSTNHIVGDALSAFNKVTNVAGVIPGDITARLNQVTGQAASLLNQANEAANLLGSAGSVINQATGKASAVLATATTAADSVQNVVGGIAGAKATELASKATATMKQVDGLLKTTGSGLAQINQAVGIATSISGVAGSKINAVAGKATRALGVAMEARAKLGTVMGDIAGTADRLGKLANSGSTAAAKIAEIAQNPAIPADAKAALTAAAGKLATSSEAVNAASASTKAVAGNAQSSMAEQTAAKTICDRMPSHEPWQWHVKEGQQSPQQASTTEEEKAAIKRAEERPGQGLANGQAPELVKVTETIQTGTGSVVRDVIQKATPLLKVGSALVRNDVLSAVKEASSVAGVDVGYLMAKASEMGFNPHTKLGDTHGLMQIGKGVFNQMVGQYGAKLGVGLKDINDPRANALMGAMMAKENALLLKDRGHTAGPTELNMSHLMGAATAARFLTNMARNPSADAFGQVAEDFVRSHRDIFYGQGGKAKTMEEVYDTFRTKIEGKAADLKRQVKELEVPPVVPPFDTKDFV